MGTNVGWAEGRVQRALSAGHGLSSGIFSTPPSPSALPSLDLESGWTTDTFHEVLGPVGAGPPQWTTVLANGPATHLPSQTAHSLLAGAVFASPLWAWHRAALR